MIGRSGEWPKLYLSKHLVCFFLRLLVWWALGLRLALALFFSTAGMFKLPIVSP
jgi:hypothetical protein